MNTVRRMGWSAAAAGLAALLAGCGMPGAPLAPSLNLPDPVNNLAAARNGNLVSLTWTMPKKNTDKLLIVGEVQVRICRKEGVADTCATAGTLQLAPEAEGTFTETLPTVLATGQPRILTYFVELDNRRGRSAGLSNPSAVLAGQAPSLVAGLDAEMRRNGILLRWTPESAATAPAKTAVRLHRKLLTPTAPKAAHGPLDPAPEPVQQSLLVESGGQTGRALDKSINFGQKYEYRAQRVVRVSVDGRALELAGPLSEPVRIDAVNVFPPAVPAALVAVAGGGENGVAIDLSWEPDTEADLAGYIVYRREGAAWQRISPVQPVVGPAFHDAQVIAGRTYNYAVTAIDQGGHESARSAEAQETVPNP